MLTALLPTGREWNNQCLQRALKISKDFAVCETDMHSSSIQRVSQVSVLVSQACDPSVIELVLLYPRNPSPLRVWGLTPHQPLWGTQRGLSLPPQLKLALNLHTYSISFSPHLSSTRNPVRAFSSSGSFLPLSCTLGSWKILLERRRYGWKRTDGQVPGFTETEG